VLRRLGRHLKIKASKGRLAAQGLQTFVVGNGMDL
jgi:hypothetical protein